MTAEFWNALNRYASTSMPTATGGEELTPPRRQEESAPPGGTPLDLRLAAARYAGMRPQDLARESQDAQAPLQEPERLLEVADLDSVSWDSLYAAGYEKGYSKGLAQGRCEGLLSAYDSAVRQGMDPRQAQILLGISEGVFLQRREKGKDGGYEGR